MSTPRYIPKRLRKIYYVYGLFRPWNGSPCYIGKGHGKRWHAHFLAAEKHYNPYLARIFAKAIRLKLEVIVVIIRSNLIEQESLQTEIALIKAIGRADLGTGPLANMTAGGEGVDSKSGSKYAKERWEALSPEEKKRRVKHFNKDGGKATALKWQKADTKEKAEFAKRMRKIGIDTRGKLSKEELSAWGKRLNDNLTPEQKVRLAEEARQRGILQQAARTPEERRQGMLYAISFRTYEERSQTAKNWHAKQTEEQRAKTSKAISIAATKWQAKRTPEELRARALKAWETKRRKAKPPK